ncbi:MAG: fumarylacetoacetate hydrolase family protein [Actinobacteria bacterium]|nr:fumarylacetoacetate hydrolase family protein [Actinomycetota bacterium]MCA1737434.1 fumarylacetoacetate hydrolase family protein [Actinomycetota bacterium]
MDLNDDENALLTHIREAREKGKTTPPRAEELGVDVESAYRVQAALGEGREVIGYKLGLIKPEGQAQMGVNSPIYGRVYEDMLFESPVPLRSFLQPQSEPEIAVVLGESLPSGSSPGAAHTAIGGIYLAIDFLSNVWEDGTPVVADVVANNVAGGGFLLGERLLSEPLEGDLRLYHNGRLLTEGPIGDIGNIGERLVWLSETVRGLEAAQVIFLGTPAAPQEAVAGTIELHGPRSSVLVADLQD